MRQGSASRSVKVARNGPTRSTVRISAAVARTQPARRANPSWSTGSPGGAGRLRGPVAGVSSARRRRPQVDRQGEDSVGEGGLGVAEHRKVHVVELHLLEEAATFGAFDGRHPAPSDRGGALAKTDHHRPGIEGLGHVARLPGRAARRLGGSGQDSGGMLHCAAGSWGGLRRGAAAGRPRAAVVDATSCKLGSGS